MRKLRFETILCTRGSVGHRQVAAGREAARPQAGAACVPLRRGDLIAQVLGTLCVGTWFSGVSLFYDVLLRSLGSAASGLGFAGEGRWVGWCTVKECFTYSVNVRGSICIAGRAES